MIAIKQTKLTSRNNIIQEKQIKNTTKQAAVEENSANYGAILPKSATNNINTAATNTTTTTSDGNHHQHNQHRQQRSNETRSETKTMERNAQALAAGNPSAIKSSSVAVVATAAAAATTTPNALTTSTKIQQRQQKFLAAAAKSATSTQHSNQPQSPLSKASVSNTSGARYTMASSTTATSKDGKKGESDADCDKASDSVGKAASNSDERSLQRQERATATESTAASIDDHQSGLISCVSVASKAVRAPSETTASEINSGNNCQGESARKFSDDTSDNGCEYRQYQQSVQNHHHHNHRHHHQHQQQQPEVRRSGESKEDTDDNINIKNNTIKHNNHNYYHHHYNHNYQNFHQHNYPHLQYQLAQITTTTTQNQTAQPQQQHVMAHYKFHNDCQSSVLNYEQVKRLDFVMDQVVPIHGRGNTPTLFVKLKELIRLVKYKLQNEHSIEIRDVRLNGGAASYVLAPENSHYNDLDLIFGTDLSNEDRFDVIRDVVLECLMEFYPKEHNAQRQQQCQQEGLPINCEHLSRLSVSHNIHNDAGTIDDDAQSEQSSRSNRSSSFESDNLNITTNESDDESEEDDDDGNIVVRIDSHNVEEKNNKDNHSDINCSIKSNSYETNIEALGHLESNGNKDAKTNEACAVSMKSDVKKQSDQISYSQHTIQYQNIQMPPNNCAIKEAYVHKMVKVNDDDRWSLISLGVQQSETNNYNQLHQQQQASINYSQAANPARIVDSSMSCNGSTTITTGITSCKDNMGHYNNQLRQSPYSIELKFVDRMRRKFEFSVDSFQIILDSLIQFYDYAPQSTITIQRKLADIHPSSTMINTHSTACRRTCGHCCDEPRQAINCAPIDHEVDNSKSAPQQETFNNKTKVINDFLDNEKKRGRHHHKNCKASLSSPRSYYELQLEPGNSLSNSSVASSSGCSSSSSVVSSSSSSLSCDEDQEDLYCDVDSSPSSSASTSSLLSTTTVSVLSPNGNRCGLAEHQDQSKKASIGNNTDRQVSQKLAIGKQTEKQASKTTSIDCDRRLEKLRLKQEARKQCKVDASDLFRENLCDFGTSKLSSCAVISENFYPTVIGRSEYGNFKEALYHLEKKLIATRSPEEIRGGGLLKYCNLLVKNYKPTNVYQIRTLERYMCSRFFIDFSDLNQQRSKLESYLANHFSDDPIQKFDYLTILHNVVQRSTVCLMNHELRLTLNMIRDLAYELNEQQQKQQHQGQQGKPLTMAQAAQQRVSIHQQSSRQHDEQQQHQYQQQKPVVLQSGAYRVKLVNYALAKSA